MFSNNGESDTFHSSFINEKDSLITDFSYENYYPFMIKYPDIDSSVNDEFIFDNQKNPNSIFFEIFFANISLIFEDLRKSKFLRDTSILNK